MKIKPKEKNKAKTCSVNRKKEAIEALFSLAWKKEKKNRPKWLIEELNNY